MITQSAGTKAIAEMRLKLKLLACFACTVAHLHCSQQVKVKNRDVLSSPSPLLQHLWLYTYRPQGCRGRLILPVSWNAHICCLCDLCRTPTSTLLRLPRLQTGQNSTWGKDETCPIPSHVESQTGFGGRRNGAVTTVKSLVSTL